MKKIVVMGAGQLGESVARLASEIGYKVIGFMDDYKDNIEGYCIIGKFAELDKLKSENITHVIPAFNIPQQERVNLVNRLLEEGFKVPSLIHKTVYQGINNEIGSGSILFPYTVLGSNIIIGKGCLIKSFSTIGSYVKLSDGINIYSSATIGARSIIDKNTLFYMHSGCADGIKIAENCKIYGNSLVIKDIQESNTNWAGTPAYKILKK
jgi:UDP-3-O-[3-hydroxymyristoyl] glucosamine N-acyltransferase